MGIARGSFQLRPMREQNTANANKGNPSAMLPEAGSRRDPMPASTPKNPATRYAMHSFICVRHSVGALGVGGP